MAKQPLAEVFGFKIDNFSATAERHRRYKLCPFNNKVPNCTKDKANDPLGVCSIYDTADPSKPDLLDAVITCPIRFRQDWMIAEHAATFFFGPSATWTSLQEVRLADANGNSAGNIDLVLVAYDAAGKVIDFGSLEVQAVYISGNVRKPFEYYMTDPANRQAMDWGQLATYYPRPDFLSSSRKRLVPQMLYKGGILQAWGKKQAVALQSSFYDTLPQLPEVSPQQADIAWLLYDLQPTETHFELVLTRTIYTQFDAARNAFADSKVAPVEDFIELLQNILDDKPGGYAPDVSLLTDIPLT